MACDYDPIIDKCSELIAKCIEVVNTNTGLTQTQIDFIQSRQATATAMRDEFCDDCGYTTPCDGSCTTVGM